mmetsp:Transcript_12860/g.38657  ORF Transcript_12860/g.38657 Transcript_12860/m.38657 type:complete len:245 (-) Transcript_12860:340-1074(-)
MPPPLQRPARMRRASAQSRAAQRRQPRRTKLLLPPPPLITCAGRSHRALVGHTPARPSPPRRTTTVSQSTRALQGRTKSPRRLIPATLSAHRSPRAAWPPGRTLLPTPPRLQTLCAPQTTRVGSGATKRRLQQPSPTMAAHPSHRAPAERTLQSRPRRFPTTSASPSRCALRGRSRPSRRLGPRMLCAGVLRAPLGMPKPSALACARRASCCSPRHQQIPRRFERRTATFPSTLRHSRCTTLTS